MADEAETMWSWVTRCPDGTVGQISVVMPGFMLAGGLPISTILTVCSRDVAEKMRPMAAAHAKSTGQKVWLREYTGHIDHGEA